MGGGADTAPVPSPVALTPGGWDNAPGSPTGPADEGGQPIATAASPTSPTSLASVAGRPARALRLGRRSYPVVLPTVRDPRLHLAAVTVTLQVLGQTVLDFDLSVAQILAAVGTCAVLELALQARRQGIIAWPASALLTGNGVAFILRVPGTRHGEWWSTRGIGIFAVTAGLALLSKYVVRVRGQQLFNPSNVGLVVCFLVLGVTRADPQDLWWGPMSWGLALTFTVIITGGLTLAARLRMLGMAAAFWVTFAAGLAVLAWSGHCMTARWHVGPVCGWSFWWVLVTSPEVLVFLFFMITDPKSSPGGQVGRCLSGALVGFLAVLLVAPQRTEFATKVAILGALTLVTAARPLVERWSPAPGAADDGVAGWLRRLVARRPARGCLRRGRRRPVAALGWPAIGWPSGWSWSLCAGPPSWRPVPGLGPRTPCPLRGLRLRLRRGWGCRPGRCWPPTTFDGLRSPWHPRWPISSRPCRPPRPRPWPTT